MVDDETLDLFLVQKQLGLEHDVTGFTSPHEALKWAAENNFEMVLIDYYLGPITGDELLKDLLKIKTEFKAFLLTNFVDDKQAQVIKSKGFNDIIFKPLTLDKLKPFINT